MIGLEAGRGFDRIRLKSGHVRRMAAFETRLRRDLSDFISICRLAQIHDATNREHYEAPSCIMSLRV